MEKLLDSMTRRLQNVDTPPELTEQVASIIRGLGTSDDPEDPTPFPLAWHRSTSDAAMREALRRNFGEDAKIVPISVRGVSRHHEWQTKESRLEALKMRVDRWLWIHLRRQYEEDLRAQIFVCQNDFALLHSELDDGLHVEVSPRINTVLGYGTDAGLTAPMTLNMFMVLRYLAGFAMVRDFDRFEAVASLAGLLPGPLPLATTKDEVAWLTIVR